MSDREVEAKLDQTVPEIRFDKIPLHDVVDFLRDITGANIFVNWHALKQAGIERDAPISLRLRNVKVVTTLDLLLDQAAGEKSLLAYSTQQGVITISTIDDLGEKVFRRPNRDERPDEQGEAILDRVLPQLILRGIALDDTIDFLRDATEANIYVKWRTLEKAGVTPKTRIHFQGNDVPLSAALDWILKEASTEQSQVGYRLSEGVITLSTVEDLRAATTLPADE